MPLTPFRRARLIVVGLLAAVFAPLALAQTPLKFQLDWSGNRVVDIAPRASQLPMPGYGPKV